MFLYTVIIPIKDEERNIEPLIQELERVMESLMPWELICINDGSTDKSLEILHELSKSKSYLRVLSFEKSHGQSHALAAGFKEARGKAIITLDGDGQNDPADIPKLLALLEEADLVCGYRMHRKDSFGKRVISRIANKVRQRFLSDGVRDTGCSLKAYRREALCQIPFFQGFHRFLPALFLLHGFSVREVPVHHRPRLTGKSHYHFFNRSLGPILDMLYVYWKFKKKL